MTTESIFHRLVKDEDSHTQLLCNMLKRDENFRKSFFGLAGVCGTAAAEPQHIHSQRQDECGRIDILISSPSLEMIIEAKTELLRGMTPKQLLIDDPRERNYVYRLKREAKEKSEVWLVYLAPRKWRHWDDKDKSISEFNERQNGKVRACIVPWEKVASLLPWSDKTTPTISLGEDFRLLLSERFGPTTLTSEETKTMFSPDFPAGVALKLISLIYDISRQVEKKKSAMTLEIDREAYGFGGRINDKQTLAYGYIGCWLQVFEITGSPLCFAIKDISQEERVAFTTSLFTVYGQEPVPNQGDWIVGFVPEPDMSAPDAVGLISGKIKRIFGALSRAGDSNELS